MKLIKRFWEKVIAPDGALDVLFEGFVEYSDGSKEACSEKYLEELWWQWVNNPNGTSYREDTYEYTIFAYGEPIQFDNKWYLKKVKYLEEQEKNRLLIRDRKI
jgi:hypothetical protein